MAAASGLTVKEMVLETRETVRGLDEKLDTVIVDYGTRLTAVEAEIGIYKDDRRDIKTAMGHWEIYRDDRKWGITIVVGLVGLWISAMIAVLSGCTETPPVVVTPMPTAIPVETAIPTVTPTLTWTSTPEATATPTPDWSATPTQIGTATLTIYEVTPIGTTPELLNGNYTPYGAPGDTQNVRYGPGIDKAIRYRLAAGKTVRVYARLSSLPFEAWLCLDEPRADGKILCNEALALVYAGRELGNLEIEDEIR